MPLLIQDKQTLRSHLRRIRDQIFIPGTLLYQQRAEAFLNNFYETIAFTRPYRIAGYMPRYSELNVLPLLTRLFNEGHQLAMPRCLPDDLLAFHIWSPTDRMERNAFHVLEPIQGTSSIDPEIMLVPFLGFDKRGHRLGYGKGFYDRTLANATLKNHCITVGVGYNEQEIDEVPIGEHDQSLDFIITDNLILKLKP